ncbi:MAG: hypothetical protein N4A31_01570 [Rickettsiales bacterium]|jgi:hypothetical protein|nr:hypothetical protein [Rickettsiales bacterium]
MPSNYKSAFETQHPMLVFVARTVQGTLFSTGIKIAYKLNQQLIDYLAEKGANAIKTLLFSSKLNEDNINCEPNSDQDQAMVGIDDSNSN